MIKVTGVEDPFLAGRLKAVRRALRAHDHRAVVASWGRVRTYLDAHPESVAGIAEGDWVARMVTR